MSDLFSNLRIHFGHYRACTPEWSWIPRKNNWEGYMLWLVIEGEGTVKKLEKSGYTELYRLQPGSCLVYRMDRDYLVEHNQENPLSIYGVYFKLYDAKKNMLNLSEETLPEYNLMNDFNLLSRLMKRTIDLFLQDSEDIDLINTYFRAALMEYINASRFQLKSSSASTGPVGKLISLFKRYPEQHYSLEKISEIMKCSKNSALRIVKKETGLTPMVLQNSIKVEMAKEYLYTSNLSISELAEELGYSDTFYFSKVFKQLTGMPPGQYRSRGIGVL